ncbi:MAG: hypothetical protein AAF937_12280 [Planctomycetota bacterium]
MKMQVRWFVTGAIASAAVGALLGAAAFQPGLEPPAGQVSDTSPSLADIEAKIDALGSAGADQPRLSVSGRFGSGPNTTEVILPGSSVVRVRSLIVTYGSVDLIDGNGVVIEELTAGGRINDGAGQTIGFAQYNLNVDMQLPVSIRQRQGTTPAITLLYTNQ